MFESYSVSTVGATQRKEEYSTPAVRRTRKVVRTKGVSVALPSKTHRTIIRLCQQYGTNVSDVLRRVITIGLTNYSEGSFQAAGKGDCYE